MPKRTVEDRFWAKVDKTGECWLWTGATILGYGALRVTGETVYAHRLAHELLIGPIPDGYEVDHLCYARACVNPAHLEAVTKQENIRRSQDRRWARTTLATTCGRGHAFDEVNTYWWHGRRQCKTCLADNQRRRNKRSKDGSDSP